MATFNELIAQLNASSDNILANAAKTNIKADNMNQTLDGMGVKELSGIAEIQPEIIEEPQYRIRDQLNRDFLQGGLLRDAKQSLGDTYSQLKQSSLGQGLGSIKNFAMDGLDLGKMALSGIGNMIMPGLGYVLSNLPKDSASNKFNRSFTVGGANMPNDPYGYYGALRAGNLNQDPFGRNPVSAFGNYTGTLAKDANYSGTNKFNLAKQDFANNYFDQNAINAGGITVDNNIYSGADYQGGGGNDGNVGGGNMSASDFSDDTAGTPFRRGGIASL